jgi:hypothetical protein
MPLYVSYNTIEKESTKFCDSSNVNDQLTNIKRRVLLETLKNFCVSQPMATCHTSWHFLSLSRQKHVSFHCRSVSQLNKVHALPLACATSIRNFPSLSTPRKPEWNFPFMLPCYCIVINFFLNSQTDASINQIYSVIKLYMFRASSLPIIRSSLLYIRHW